MKVLHLNSGLAFGGGLEKVIMDLMIHNKETSNYLCVINDQISTELINGFKQEEIMLCNRRVGSKNFLIPIIILIRILIFIKKNQIDILHCHNPFSLKFAFVIRKLCKIKVVFTVHDTNVFSKKLARYKVDRYIAISKSVYKQISEFVPTEKIDLIYNGVDINKFVMNKREDGNDGEKFRLACVARIMPSKKGQDLLIEALNIIQNQYSYTNFECVFAGSTEDKEAMRFLNSLVQKYNLIDNVKFVGNVKEIKNIYSNTDLFILPSRYEGFGLVVVEALAAGCNVIVSRNDGPLEIIKENEEYGLSFENENYFELANKIKIFMEKDNLHFNKLKTLKYITENYSLEKMVSGYTEVYLKSLG